ncbi:hypothetical protein JYU34_007999 [Plutella xylostella]|uniref:Uncharacterized protein n=1 Tax=Plutella xylostella TaxID=51655 RepID=A0ABQ7QNL8_PLUXY|nr:hypothetical protein JYU34_007999 [Plutella xylostella]
MVQWLLTAMPTILGSIPARGRYLYLKIKTNTHTLYYVRLPCGVGRGALLHPPFRQCYVSPNVIGGGPIAILRAHPRPENKYLCLNKYLPQPGIEPWTFGSVVIVK